MTDPKNRLIELPPRRRLLLERMLKGRQQDSAWIETTTPVAANVDTQHAAAIACNWAYKADGVASPVDASAEATRSMQRYYDTVNRQLNAGEFGPFSFFLNFGYVQDATPQAAVVDLPPAFINRNSAKLVLELVGECPIKGRAVLDVGCGRGGALHLLNRFLGGDDLTGIDLSFRAISFCARTHTAAAFRFVEGDAERLPFRNSSFDVVTNVESSHTYPNRIDFYREVWRVLRPRGRFLYTDLLPRELFKEALADLIELGFAIERDRDITNNVVLSCEDVGRRRLGAFAPVNDALAMREFLGTPGSMTYNEMKQRVSQYRIVWAARED